MVRCSLVLMAIHFGKYRFINFNLAIQKIAIMLQTFYNRRRHRIFVPVWLSLLCAVFAVLWATTANAQQQKNESLQFTFENLGFSEDRVAAGTVPTLVYELPVPHSWADVQPTFYLHISHSSLLLPDLSQMTVFYNDVPIAVGRLTADNE